MPQAVVVAAIPAVAAIGGAVLSTRATNRATKAQLAANDQAMAYTREQDAKVEGERARAREERLQAVRDWYATYGEEGIKKWGPPKGISLAELRGGTGKQVSTAGHGGGNPGVTVTRKSPTMADLASMTSGAMQGAPVAEADQFGAALKPDQFATALEPRRRTMADLTAYGANYG
jgi:hypothetical protein